MGLSIYPAQSSPGMKRKNSDDSGSVKAKAARLTVGTQTHTQLTVRVFEPLADALASSNAEQETHGSP
jgi:hypothetical protein